MTIRRAIATIFGCILAGAAFGGGIGYGIGKLAPGYYLTVFRGGIEPGFDPVSVGIGLGLTQGVPAGLVTGLVLVAIFCWREIRLQTPGNTLGDSSHQKSKSFVFSRWPVTVIGPLIGVGIGICFFAGLFIGLIRGETGEQFRQYLHERRLLDTEIRRDPAFASIAIERRSDGGAYLSGELADPLDLERLRKVVSHVLGEPRTDETISAVTIRR